MAAANGSRNGLVTPAAFPPPVDPVEEFVEPADGPRGRAHRGRGGDRRRRPRRARLRQPAPPAAGRRAEALTERLGEVPVAVVEKGKVCGAHNLSGAIMRPSALQELFPDVPAVGLADATARSPSDAVYRMLSAKPRLPHPDAAAVQATTATTWSRSPSCRAGWPRRPRRRARTCSPRPRRAKLLVDDGQVVGIRSGDKGRGKDGEPLGNFEPGSDVLAKATVLAEGTWGHLTGAAIRDFDLGDREPQVWALGVKEVWEVPKPLDQGHPHAGLAAAHRAKYKEFGGSWIYPMGEDKVSIGFVVGLDYADVDVLGPRPPAAVQDPPAHPRDPRGRQARRLGRQGASPRAATGRCPSSRRPAR